MNKRNEVLLLGGMGYIGRQLQKSLISKGYKLHVIDKNAPEHGNKDTNFYRGLLSDETVLKDVLPICDKVFFLASDSVPGTTARSPLEEGNRNITPFLKFLDIFIHYNDIQLVYISSGGTIYGNANSVPVDESSAIAPISYHGAGKAAIEAFLHVCSGQSHKITVLRPSNLYGPFQPYIPNFGIIRNIMAKVKRNEPVEIWGDGEIIRDYLFIEDFVTACLACIKSAKEEISYRVFNVSSGKSLSINQLCDLVEDVTKKKLERVYLSERMIDVKSVVLDNSKIKRELGWKPIVDIQEGLQRTWNWMRGLPV